MRKFRLDPFAPNGVSLENSTVTIAGGSSTTTGGGVQSVVAGSNITVDSTDPANPIVSSVAGGTGDVVGPAVATDSNFVSFNTTTGKLIKDSGVATSSVVTDISGLVPYTGATGDVALGTAGITSDRLTSTGLFELHNGAAIDFYTDAGTTFTGLIRAESDSQFMFSQSYDNILDFSGITTVAKTFSFPDVTGTIALTSDIPDVSGFITDITGQDLSLADNSTSAFITLGDIPTLAIDDLSDVVCAAPDPDDVLTFDGANWVCRAGVVGAGNGIVEYLTDTDSPDVTDAKYLVLSRTPNTAVETSVTASVISTNSPQEIKSFIMSSTGIGVTTIPAGVWEFSVWAKNSGGTTAGFEIVVYAATVSGGVVTLGSPLFTTSNQTLTTSIIDYEISSVQPAFTGLTTTHRLVFLFRATQSVPVSRDVTIYLGGSTRASHANTPLQTRHNDLAGLNVGDYVHMTAAQAVVLGNTSGTNTGDNATNTQYSGLVSNATHTGDVTGATALTIANKVTMTGTAPVSVSGSPTVIAGSAVAISMAAATASVNGYATSTQITKLDGIEALADVTDATNVNAAGATMNSDTSLVGNGYFLDEDAMTSNDATKVPSQQSVKAYADTKVTTGGALGTPTSGTLTNCTGTASGLTAGTVTTNANLTGNVTSVGNATTIAAGVVTNAMLTTTAGDVGGAGLAWTPTFTGFSADPSGVHRYTKVGKFVTLYIRHNTSGTSNATTFTITLPVTAATITNMLWTDTGLLMDNNVGVLGSGLILSAGTTMAFFTTALVAGAFTNSGNKRCSAFQITYEVA